MHPSLHRAYENECAPFFESTMLLAEPEGFGILDTDERREKMLAMLGEEDRLISKIRDEWERKSHLSGQERWAVLTKHVRAEKKPKLGAVRA